MPPTSDPADESRRAPQTQAAADDEGDRLLAELTAAGGPNSEAAMALLLEDDQEHITPRGFMEYSLGLHGRTLEDTRLPATLIATFQTATYAELAAATGARQAEQVPASVMRVDQGSVEGRPVALRRLGIGAPAAVSVLEELIALGVRDILVIGTGGSLQPALPIGSLALATGAIREDGASFHYAPAGQEVAPDPELTQALGEATVALGGAVATGPVWTTDAPYRELASKVAAYGALGALAVEMEAAALFALARFRGVRLALLLAISDELFHTWRPGFHGEELRAAQRLSVAAALRVAAPLPGPTQPEG